VESPRPHGQDWVHYWFWISRDGEISAPSNKAEGFDAHPVASRRKINSECFRTVEGEYYFIAASTKIQITNERTARTDTHCTWNQSIAESLAKRSRRKTDSAKERASTKPDTTRDKDQDNFVKIQR